MIAHISGTVVSKTLNSVIVEAHGVGYDIIVTPNTASAFREGEAATITTQLIVREDSQTLYGFGDADEKDVFNVLISSPGIGPKVALTILAMLSPDELRMALASEDEGVLVKVPGIGKKTAKQLIANIGNKLGEPHAAVERKSQVQAVEASATQIVDALQNLGWNAAQAKKAVAQAEKELPGGSDGELLRLSLQMLGGAYGA